MNYSVSIEKNRKYVIVYIDGPMTTEIALIVGKEAINRAQDNGIKCFLYDLRKSRNVQNGLKNYEFGYKDIGNINLEKSNRIAILTEAEDHSHDFIETVMINNGYTVKIFNDEKDAVSWLLE